MRQGENATLLSDSPDTARGPTARPVFGDAGAGGWRQTGPPSFAKPARTPLFGRRRPAPGRDVMRGVFRPDGKRKLWAIIGAAAVALVVVIAIVVGTRSSPSNQASGQTELPFTGIDFRLSPGGVAVDKADNVYVSSEGMYGRVVELAAGSNTTTVLPFTGLFEQIGRASCRERL